MLQYDHATSENLNPIENRTLDFRPLNALNKLNTGSKKSITEFEIADFIFKANQQYGADIEN